MFHYATNFNQDISAWNVSNVKYMSNMFNSATNFNQDISGWDVSSVRDMKKMFSDATSFNQDLSQWSLRNSMCLDSMIDNSGLDIDNYDAFLEYLASLDDHNLNCSYEDYSIAGLNKVNGLTYCDETSRTLVESLHGELIGDSLYEDCIYGVDVATLQDKITIYPNPANKILHIESSKDLSIKEMHILNVQGQEIQRFISAKQELDLGNLPTGIYFLKIITSLGVINKQVMKE